MVNLWMPGVTRYRASRDNGKMAGGAPRVTWHSTENDPNTTSAMDVAKFINLETHFNVHLVWNPVTGEIVQMLPANVGGLGLERKTDEETNNKGKYNIQIEVVAFARNPFTNTACRGLDRIMDWVRTLGVEDTFPGGSPLAYGPNGEPAYGPNNGDRSVEAWQKSGHFTHSQVPFNRHGDPGAISTAKILAAGTKPKPAPVDPPGTYRVVSGDTLWALARKFNVTVDQLMKWNRLPSTVLAVGQLLVVKPQKPTVHLSNLKYGMTNDDVKRLQRTLIARGWKIEAGVTGYFGDQTRSAVAAFQRHQGWTGDDADGIPGRVTLERLGFNVVA